jgi:hypothetical protein
MAKTRFLIHERMLSSKELLFLIIIRPTMQQSTMRLSILFLIILMGAISSIRAQTLRIALPDTSVPYASPVLIPVYIGQTTGMNVVATELGVVFRHRIVVTLGAEISRSLVQTGWSVEDNVISGSGNSDTLLIAMSTARDTLSGKGVLIHLLFETADIRRPTTTPLKLRALFNDGTPSTISAHGSITLTGINGLLRTRPDSIFPGQPLRIRVDDLDEDPNPSQIDTVQVRTMNQRTGDVQRVELIETDVTSGRFRGRLNTQPDTAGTPPANGMLGIAPGDTIQVTYIDILNASGITDTLQNAVPVRYGTHIGIHRYSLFALHSMHIKTGSEVHSGFVGVQDFGAPLFQSGNVELAINPQVTTGDSVIISAPRVKVQSHSHIQSTLVYSSLVSTGSGVTIGLPIEVGTDYWPLTGVPEFQAGTPGSQDITVRNNRTEEIMLGAYNDISVRTNGTLIFTGGTYHLGNLDIGTRGKVIFRAPSVLLIKNRFAQSNSGYFGPGDQTGIDASNIQVFVEGINGNNGRINVEPKAAQVGVDTEYRANLYAPNGTIFLREKSDVTGSFIGKDIIVGTHADVHLKSAWPAPDYESPLPPLPPTPPPPPSIRGDFDQDGDIDLTDFLIFARAFGRTTDPIFDLNDNGQVTIQDFLVFLDLYRQYNRS